MATFAYTARDSKGIIVKSKIDADNKDTARFLLKQQGYFVTSLEELKIKIKETQEAKKITLPFFSKVKLDELVIFSRQFATLVRAGLTLTNTLSTLKDQTSNPVFKKVIEKVILDVEAGETLSEAFEKHPRVFSQLFVSLIRAGETGGTLDAVLEEIAEYYDKEQDLIQKIRSAFAYPIVVVVIATGIVIFLLTVVVPVFDKVYSQMNVSLPLPTVLLIEISKTIRKFWYILILLVIGSIIFYNKIKDTKTGKPIVDNIKLQLPIFGNLNLKTSLSRFTRTFALLMGAGVPVIRCLEITSALSINYYVSIAISQMISGIREGESITDQMRLQKIFPSLLTQMSQVGENTGKIEDMYMETSRFYDREIEHIVKRLTAMIEPILTIGLGVIVGFIAISLYLPMFDLIRAIR